MSKIRLSLLLATIAFNAVVIPAVAAESSISSTMLVAKIEAPEAGSSATPTPEEIVVESTSEAEIATESAVEETTVTVTDTETATDEAQPVIEEKKSFFDTLKEKLTELIIKIRAWKSTDINEINQDDRLITLPASESAVVLEPTIAVTPTVEPTTTPTLAPTQRPTAVPTKKVVPTAAPKKKGSTEECISEFCSDAGRGRHIDGCQRIARMMIDSGQAYSDMCPTLK